MAEILARDYVERALKNRNCFKVTEYSTAERWVMKTGRTFTIPKDCDRETFDNILIEIGDKFRE